MHHLEASVAYKCVNFAVGICHLNAQGSSHFVAHAGVTVLCVVSASLVGGPHSLETAGKGSACGDDHCIISDGAANSCDSTGLGQLTPYQLYVLGNGTGISCLDVGLEVCAGVGQAA